MISFIIASLIILLTSVVIFSTIFIVAIRMGYLDGDEKVTNFVYSIFPKGKNKL